MIHRNTRRTACVIASLLLFTLAPLASAQNESAPDEAKVKAAFLLRFLQYVDWPQDARSQPSMPITIGVVAADAILTELSQMTAARPSPGRPVAVHPAKAGDDLASFHMVFIGSAEKARVAQYAGAVRGRPVLIVTESPGALEQGSMINFVLAERRVRFEIGLDRAESAGLSVSSRLLSVAMRVHKGERATGTTLAFAYDARRLRWGGRL